MIGGFWKPTKRTERHLVVIPIVHVWFFYVHPFLLGCGPPDSSLMVSTHLTSGDFPSLSLKTPHKHNTTRATRVGYIMVYIYIFIPILFPSDPSGNWLVGNPPAIVIAR